MSLRQEKRVEEDDRVNYRLLSGQVMRFIGTEAYEIFISNLLLCAVSVFFFERKKKKTLLDFSIDSNQSVPNFSERISLNCYFKWIDLKVLSLF